MSDAIKNQGFALTLLVMETNYVKVQPGSHSLTKTNERITYELR